MPKIVSYENFINAPTADNFYNLGSDRINLILKEFEKLADKSTFLPIIMEISAFAIDDKVAESALACSEVLYRELYTWAEKNDNASLINNNLLVHLGLIKCEDKKFKTKWNTESCLSTLEKILKTNSIPQSATDTLKFFMEQSRNGLKK